MSEPDTASLGDLISITRGTTYKSALLNHPGPVLLGLASIARNGGFRSDNLKTYGGDSPDHLLVRPGELFASLKDVTQSADLLGSVARVPSNGPLGRLTQDTVRLDLISDRIAPEYLYLALLDPSYRTYCRSHATGTTNLGLPRDDFLAYPVRLPPIDEQRRIAGVLGALDDLIETDRNAHLIALELAQAIYQRTVASSVEAVSLGDAGRWLSGGTPSTSNVDYWDGDTPWISAASLKSFFVATSDRTVTREGAANGTRLVPKGTILFVVRGMSLKNQFRVGVAQRGVAFGQDCKAIIVDEHLPRATVAIGLLAQSDSVLQLVDEAGHGTGRLPTDRIEKLLILLPTSSEVEAVERTLETLLDLGSDAEASARTLSAARDELLPLLLSGRVHVNAARSLAG